MSDVQPVPALGMGGADPLMSKILQRSTAADARSTDLQGQFAASQQREKAAREAQAKALAPVREREKAMLEAAPKPPAEQPVPTAPAAPKIDAEGMGNVLSLVTALAAMGGAFTRTPLTAALNAFAGGANGAMQGQNDAYQRSLKEFETKLKEANAKNESISRQYQRAREKFGTDIQALQNEARIIAAETQSPIDIELAARGDLVSLAKIHDAQDGIYTKALPALARIMEAHEAAATRHQDAVTREGDAGWQMFTAKDGTLSRVNVRTGEVKPIAGSEGLQKAGAGGAKITESEQRSTTNWNEMEFANKKLEDLAKKGVSSLPISAQMFGRLYNPETGGWSATVQQEIRNSLTSPEEKQSFDAALAYTLAQAHAQGGARPSPYQVQIIWNSYIPMAGEDASTQDFKRTMRENALESVKVSAGKGVAALEKDRAKKAPAAAGPYDDPDKERRYQEWKAKHAGQ